MAKDSFSASPGLFDQMLSGEAPNPPEAKVATGPLSVSEATDRIKGVLGGVGTLAIEGELTRATIAASGHVYFTLKDSGASISCILWKGKVASATKGEPAERG